MASLVCPTRLDRERRLTWTLKPDSLCFAPLGREANLGSPARNTEYGCRVAAARYFPGSKLLPLTRNTHI
jgi:hypothetical protein